MTNLRVVESQLKQKLKAGTVTSEDVAQAASVAKAFGSVTSRALFANVKRQAADNADKFQQRVKQTVQTLDKAEQGTETVAEMRALLKQVEQQIAGREDVEGKALLRDVQKRYAVTRIMNDLPADEQDGEFADE